MDSVDQHEEIIQVHDNIKFGDDVELKECEETLRSCQLAVDPYLISQEFGSAMAHAVKQQNESFYELFVSNG